MVLYIGIYIESDWLYHAEWVALSNGQSGSELAEYSRWVRHKNSTVFRGIPGSPNRIIPTELIARGL